MLLLMRVLIALVMAALFAWPVLIGLRTGQINFRKLMFQRRSHPSVFWAIVAVSLFLAIAFIAIALAILAGLL
jgi:hypothetical protein